VSYDPTSAMRALESFLAASGLVTLAQISEPKSPPDAPGGRIAAAIFMDESEVVATTIGGQTIELHTAILRLTGGFLDEPADNHELALASAVNAIVASILTDADLGGQIRTIDFAGHYGRRLRSRWGYIDIGGTMFRSVDTEIPMLVDGNASATP